MARFSEALSTLLVPHQMCDRPGAPPLARRGASVTFEDVTFAYPDCPTIFENLSLHIGAGQRVGLVGASGGGKSTLFALVQRFYDIQSGRILIDGQDITQVTQQSLREAIGVVPQDISLFHRSLIENIRYARPEASDDEVWQAAQVGPLRRLHRRAAAGSGHARRRSRCAPVGRAAATHRDCARVPEGRATPAAR